ncbi:hypothetical protein AMTRI_Chr07g76780 [Amborella trichopoda]
MTEETKKTIFLRSSDEEIFELAEDAAIQCETIKIMIEDGCTTSEKGIPLPNVSSKVLSKIIEYLNHHVNDDKVKGKEGDKGKGKEGEEEEKKGETVLTKWDEEFLKVDMQTHFDIALAANYLNVKHLLDITCLEIADRIKDWSVEDVRKTFGIENDFSPEEEDAVRKDNEWAFE